MVFALRTAKQCGVSHSGSKSKHSETAEWEKVEQRKHVASTTLTQILWLITGKEGTSKMMQGLPYYPATDCQTASCVLNQSSNCNTKEVIWERGTLPPSKTDFIHSKRVHQHTIQVISPQRLNTIIIIGKSLFHCNLAYIPLHTQSL